MIIIVIVVVVIVMIVITIRPIGGSLWSFCFHNDVNEPTRRIEQMNFLWVSSCLARPTVVHKYKTRGWDGETNDENFSTVGKYVSFRIKYCSTPPSQEFWIGLVNYFNTRKKYIYALHTLKMTYFKLRFLLPTSFHTNEFDLKNDRKLSWA